MKTYKRLERREFLRVDFETSVKYSVCSDEQVTSAASGLTKNISASGILFTTNQKLDVGTYIAISLDKHTLTDVVEIDDSVIVVDSKLLGKVVRTEELVADKKYDIGISFLRSDSEDYDDEVAQIISILKGE